MWQREAPLFLANATRRRILSALGGDELSAGYLAEALDCPRPTLRAWDEYLASMIRA